MAKQKTKELKYIQAETKAQDDGTIEMVVFSDDSEDRMGDTVDPEGWELESFKRNPVLLWAHDSSMDASIPAIGNVKNLRVDNNGKLKGSLSFDMEDEFAKKVYKKYKKGILRATSVGFLPKEADNNKSGGNDFQKQELLEISCVNVPANRNALTQIRGMRKSTEDNKEIKAVEELMNDYLEKHHPVKEETNKDSANQKQEENEEDPLVERLTNISNSLKNTANEIKTIAEQRQKVRDLGEDETVSKLYNLTNELRKEKKKNEKHKKEKGNLEQSLYEIRDSLKRNDRAVEGTLKRLNNYFKSKHKGGEK